MSGYELCAGSLDNGLLHVLCPDHRVTGENKDNGNELMLHDRWKAEVQLLRLSGSTMEAVMDDKTCSDSYWERQLAPFLSLLLCTPSCTM